MDGPRAAAEDPRRIDALNAAEGRNLTEQGGGPLEGTGWEQAGLQV
jgi:hypothetical protein